MRRMLNMNSMRAFVRNVVPFLLLAACGEPTDTGPLSNAQMADLGEPALVELVRGLAQAAVEMPEDASRRGTLGLALEANQKWALAAESFEKAAALDGSQPEYPTHAAICLLRSERPARGGKLLDGVVEKFPEFAPGHFHRGVMLLDQGDAGGALKEFETCAELASWFRNIRLVIAEALIGLGRAEEALGLIDSFLPGRSYDMRAHHVRGLALQGLGRDIEAQSFLGMGADVERSALPDQLGDRLRSYIIDTQVLLSAAGGLRSAGQNKEAIEMLNLALERKPDDVQIIVSLATFERKGENAPRAIELLAHGATVAPGSVELWIETALVQYGVGNHTAGLAAAAKAVQLAPSSAHAQYLHGRSLRALGRLAPARTSFEEAHRLNPDSEQFGVALGEVLVTMQAFDVAKPLLEALVEKVPQSYWPRHYLCYAQFKLDDLDEARANLGRLRSLYSGDERLDELEASFRNK